jgi:hypothetical protein
LLIRVRLKPRGSSSAANNRLQRRAAHISSQIFDPLDKTFLPRAILARKRT